MPASDQTGGNAREAPARGPSICFEPRFVEEAVLQALATARELRPRARLFHREREAVYRLGDAEQRARAFDELNVRWFAQLGLARPLERAVAEQPAIENGIGRILVGRPPRRRDAGAELLVRAPRPGEDERATRTLRLLVPPEDLLQAEDPWPWLWRELQHVADMVDPAFGYRPEIDTRARGPGHARVLRARYRAAWNASIDGRLVRARRLAPSAGEEVRRAFAAAFRDLPPADAEAAFGRLFFGELGSHAAIVGLIVALDERCAASRGVCPLCGFATVDLAPGTALAPSTRAALVSDFPGWRAELGCCAQCADLYRSHALSLAGEAALPGIR